MVTAEKNESHANVEINQAAALPGIATVVVTAQDGETSITYTINFTQETEIPIIRAKHVNKNTATVKGSIGGTSAKNTQDNGKFGSKGHYWGITLADGNTFKTGDVLHVMISEAAQQGTLALYEDADGTTLLYNTEVLGEVGDNVFTLPASLNGKSTFYICRPTDESNKWNAFVMSLSVYRNGGETAIENAEEAVKAVKFFENGQLMIEKNGVIYNAQGAIVK